jgi:heptosyltransferase III
MSNTPLLTAAACLQRCALYIGNDGGQMHLSAAAGVPTLGLFGPTPAHHYRPWGERSDYVQAPEPFEGLEARIPEAMKAGLSLMTGITVDAVESAARRLYLKVSLGQSPRIGERASAVLGSGMDIDGKPGTM